MISWALKKIDALLGTGQVTVEQALAAISMDPATERLEDTSKEYLKNIPNLGPDHAYLIEHVRLLFPVTVMAPNQDYNRSSWLLAIHNLRTVSKCGWQLDVRVSEADKQEARAKSLASSPTIREMQQRAHTYSSVFPRVMQHA